MSNFTEFILKREYKQVRKVRSRLEEMNIIINWNKFNKLFQKRENKIGRPNYDKTLMLKILLLQSRYNLNDEEAEYQI